MRSNRHASARLLRKESTPSELSSQQVGRASHASWNELALFYLSGSHTQTKRVKRGEDANGRSQKTDTKGHLLSAAHCASVTQ